MKLQDTECGGPDIGERSQGQERSPRYTPHMYAPECLQESCKGPRRDEAKRKSRGFVSTLFLEYSFYPLVTGPDMDVNIVSFYSFPYSDQNKIWDNTHESLCCLYSSGESVCLAGGMPGTAASPPKSFQVETHELHNQDTKHTAKEFHNAMRFKVEDYRNIKLKEKATKEKKKRSLLSKTRKKSRIEENHPIVPCSLLTKSSEVKDEDG
ncbi:hypothetical protein STEG23_006554, partial [Scotinomys teguina]